MSHVTESRGAKAKKPDTTPFPNWAARVAFFSTIGLMFFYSTPVHSFLAVVVRYGTKGYFEDGIRVVRSHPAVYSNGVPVPSWIDAAAGLFVFFLFFAACCYALTAIRALGSLIWRRVVRTKKVHDVSEETIAS